MQLADVLTDAQRRIVLDLEQRDREERQAGSREPMSLRAVAPQVARLLYVLAVARRARVIVEFGTSHGYSTIHLAAAAERTGGHVHSVEVMPEKSASAAANLHAAGLARRVSLTVADGEAFAARLPDAIDFVLVDYPVEAFVPVLGMLRERLADGCLMFVDGGPDGYWEGAGRRLRETLEADRGFVVSRLPMHKEQLVALRRR